MVQFSVMPDLEAVCGSALRDAGICGGRVYSSIPGSATYPLVTVARTGGIPIIKERLDVARIDINVWGNSKTEARDAADAARIVLMEMEGTEFADFDAYVTCVEDDFGLLWLPDPVSKRDRYVFSVAVYAHTTL